MFNPNNFFLIMLLPERLIEFNFSIEFLLQEYRYRNLKIDGNKVVTDNLQACTIRILDFGLLLLPTMSEWYNFGDVM